MTAGPTSEVEAPKGALEKARVFCEAIKVSHSVFALPFAVAAAFIASEGWPELRLLGLIVAAVVLARTSAMAFNRWADARIDLENPRTRGRAVPAGLLRRSTMLAAAALSALGFVGICAAINPLACALSPVALGVILGYSFTKRFTWLSHAVLGLALGLSPLGAWVAVRGGVAVLPALLGLAVLLWTAGFDIIYACQDADFDTRSGLHSIPARFGIRRALRLSRALHVSVVILLVAVGVIARLGWPYAVGVACVALLLVREHSVVSPDDLSRVDMAFFTLNGLVSLVFMASVIIDTVI